MRVSLVSLVRIKARATKVITSETMMVRLKAKSLGSLDAKTRSSVLILDTFFVRFFESGF